MIHLPLVLVQDSLLNIKTPWPKLSWIGQDGGRVCGASQHLVGEVDLARGSCTKVAKLTALTKTAAAIATTSDGVFVYGILCSGDLFFWHTVTNQVRQAKGIPQLVTHHTIPPESNVMRDFLKQVLPQSFGSNVPPDEAEQTTSPVPAHHTPHIFASSTCSKVVVVVGASKVYVWERSLLESQMEECHLSQHVAGTWSVAPCPAHVPLPATHSKETRISCCYMYEENCEECHITFTFVESLCVVMSSVRLRWRGSRLYPPAAHWNSHLISFSSLGLQQNELLHINGTLISSYAQGRSLLAVAVNSWKQHSKVLYIHPSCSTAVATNIQDAVPHLRSSDQNTMRSQWISDLTWSHDSLYLFGCVMSGGLFIATRMGPLVKISCQGQGIQLQAANILGIQPHSIMDTEEMDDAGNVSVGGATSVKFHVSCHPTKQQVLLSSGLRVSVLSLPPDATKEGEVVDRLLASASHALDLFCTSAVTHDYAYIRGSTWRLAHSVLDLTQGLTNTSPPDTHKVSLWDRRVVAAAADKAGSQERSLCDDGELMQIEQVLKPLMAAWTLIGSHSGAHTVEWRSRTGEVVVVVIRLVTTLLRITAHDDHLQHQLQLLLVLHFYHQFVRVLCVCPNSFYMMKPTLQLTHRLLHTVLACERHAGERSMLSTLLILTQTLSSLEHSLTQAFTITPPLHLQTPSKVETVQLVTDAEVSNFVELSSDDRKNQHKIDNTVSLRMKKIWQCLYVNAKKVYTQLAGKKFDQESYQKSVLVLNILQNKLQNIGCDLNQRVMRLGKCHQLYFDGLYLKAIQAWKLEIMTCLSNGHGKKVVAQDLHSILYACLVHEGYVGISDFVNWLDSLLRSLFRPNKQSSPPSSQKMSATKAKNYEMKLSFEYSKINQSPKIEGVDEPTTKEESQKPKVPVRKTLFSKQMSCDSKDYTFYTMKRTSSQEHVQVTTVPWMISAIRQVMGSLGRILALKTLGCCPDVPPPHKPHVFPPLWISSTQPQGKDEQPSSKKEGAAVMSEWCVDAAAEALALSGCWGDLAVFTSWLQDAKLALVAGFLATNTTTTTHHKAAIPNNVFPLHQIKDLLCQLTNSTSTEFHNHQELLQLAAMTKLEILPVIFEECLAKMKELTLLFETFVPSQIHLPAPPVFCPLGPQDGEELILHVAADNSQNERRLRQEVAGWLRLTCQVTSAAGIAYPLLLSLLQKYSKLTQMNVEEVSCLVESLGCHQEDWHPQGPEWERITWLWHQLITLVWLLYSRDKLSLEIRSLVTNASALRQNQELQETSILKILSWIIEVNSLCEHDCWRNDLVGCAVSGASEAPSVPAVASVLARIVPHPSQLPSLLRHKADRLFETWKNTNIPVSQVEPDLKRKQNETEDISSPDIFTSLFAFYEDRCDEVIKHLLSEEEKREFSSFIDEYPTKSCGGTLQAGTIQEEFGKFLFLFVELTFMRDVQKCPQHISPVPLLVQFSHVLRRREFDGIQLKNRLHPDDSRTITNSLKHNILKTPSVSTRNTRSSVAIPEKKGLFRSLDCSKMLPRGRETVSISKRHVATTLIDTPSAKFLNNSEKENVTKLKISSPSRRKVSNLYLQGRRSRSLSKQKKRSVCVPRCRSLSVSGRRGTPKQRSSKQCSEALHWKTSPTSSNNIQDLSIRKLLHFPQCLAYNTKQVESEDTIDLLYWMMSQERQFYIPVMESDSYTLGKLVRRVNFSLDDVIVSLMWNHLPEHSSHKDSEKSYSEMGNGKLKNKKKRKKRTEMREESPELNPYNELVAPDDPETNIQVEAPIGCSTKQQDISSINDSSKDDEYISEEGNGHQERDEQLYAQPNDEGMSNLHLTQKQHQEREKKENIQYDSEPENPHHSPDTKSRSYSVILSDLINIQNRGKGSIINSNEGGERQGMASGSITDTQTQDKDSHQPSDASLSQVTRLSKTQNKRQNSDTFLVSSQAIQLEQNTSPHIKMTENNEVETDQAYSNNEELSSVVLPPLVISHKNVTKVHQVKMHAKEAKHSIRCRLPILRPPQRVSSMTGVEAPEEPSEPGIVPFVLLQVSPHTSTVSNMQRMTTHVSTGKNILVSQADPVSAEDTLDNITLPDSLHASDLEEEQSESSPQNQNMRDHILKRNNSNAVNEKSEDGATVSLCVPRGVNKRVNNRNSHRWDERHLSLKAVPLPVKSAHRVTPSDEMSTSRSERNMAHRKGNSNAKKTLKLLTLPKLSPLKKCDTKQEKTLQLKQLPVHSENRNTAKENRNVIINPWLHPKEQKVDYVKPLTIPKYFDSYHKDDRKTRDLNFLNPQQVFAFYTQSALKRQAEKFKNLKVSKKYIVPHCVLPDSNPLNNSDRKKEQQISDQVAGNLNQGFLDQLKNYTDKYKKAGYKNILKNDKEISQKEIVIHYKPTDNKKTVDTQDDLQQPEKSQLVEGNPSFLNITDGIGSEKTHSDTLVKTNLLRREKKFKNRCMNTDPCEMRAKIMKAAGTQASILQAGVLDPNTHSGLSSKSTVQTQTSTLQTVEASVLTDSVVSGKSKAVQVDSLLSPLLQNNQSCPSEPFPTDQRGVLPSEPFPTDQRGVLPSESFPTDQRGVLPSESFPSDQRGVSPSESFPSDQRGVLPPEASPSFTTSTHNHHTPSEHGFAQGLLHIFDSLSEVVKEELKDAQMNRTIHSLDVGQGDQYATQSFLNFPEKRKTEECREQVTNKDYKEEKLSQKQAAAHTLDEIIKGDLRVNKLQDSTSQTIDQDEKLNLAASASPTPSNTDVTMDKLYEEFCRGRISLEDFYQMSNTIPDEVKKEPSKTIDKKENIQTLEQQVLEAARSINESQHLVEKIKCLIQEPEAPHCKHDKEKFVPHSSHRSQTDLVMDNISKDVGWQGALSVYKTEGKADTLLRFLEAANFENITSGMIDEIIQCENITQSNEDQKMSVNGDNILLEQKAIDTTTQMSNKIKIRSDEMCQGNNVHHEEFIANEGSVATTEADLMLTQDTMTSMTHSLDLHLSSPFIRSSDSSHVSSLSSLFGEATSSVHQEEKVQQRRKEIQAWIKKQRQKRQQQAKSNISEGSRVLTLEVSNVSPENLGLTGKQLQERSEDRRVKRAKQRQSHQKKRESDIVKLLNDHEDEVAMHHTAHVKSKLVCESPTLPVTVSRKWQNFKRNFNRNSHLATKSHGNWHPSKSVLHDSVSQKKPELDEYFVKSTEEWRKKQQHSSVASPLSWESSRGRGEYCVEEKSIENSTSLQMELYYLKRCLHSKNKDKYITGLGSQQKQVTSTDKSHHTPLIKEQNKAGKSHPSQPKVMVSNKDEACSSGIRDTTQRRSLPLSATFTLPLDRISEVASNTSHSSSDTHHHGDAAAPVVPAEDDTSTDSSWTMPEEVHHLLYNKQ